MIHELARRGFEAAGERYERGRPDYPEEAIAYLVDRLRLGPGQRVADLGAGTGKLTRQLTATGSALVAIEPVEAMRAQFHRTLPDVELVPGTAEAMPLEDDSVDAVVVGQAFHWFDAPRALAEIRRVLRREGGLGLVWNVRDEREPWVAELTGIIDRLDQGAPRYRTGDWRAAFREDIVGTERLFGPLEHRSFHHVQTGDDQTFLDRVGSISYVAAAPPEDRERVLGDVGHLLGSDSVRREGGAIVMPYRTEVWVADRFEEDIEAEASTPAHGRVVQVSSSGGGVPKLPLESAWVDRLGIIGDAHHDATHGGPDQALCLYSVEAIGRVALDGHQAFRGAYGENLTLAGIEMGELSSGDRLSIGDQGLLVELTHQVNPCATQTEWFLDGRFARISPKTHPEDARWYARVLSEGRVAPGDRVVVVETG